MNQISKITLLLLLTSYVQASKHIVTNSLLHLVVQDTSNIKPSTLVAFVVGNQTSVVGTTRVKTSALQYPPPPQKLKTKQKKKTTPLFGTRQDAKYIIPQPFTTPKRPSSSLHQSSSSTEETTIIRNELPLDFPRRNDALAAIAAVRKACTVTRQIQPLRGATTSSKSEIATVTKADLSPVTVGDFASQALILHHLHATFPSDSFIAEESSEALKLDNVLSNTILQAIMELKEEGVPSNVQELMDSIDLGQTYNKDGSTKEGGAGIKRRVWCLDPIDGTKGFLRGKLDGGQYAVALALLEDGKPTIGILGCPNLPVSTNDDQYEWTDDETGENNHHSRGCIFVASKGGGCFQLPLFPSEDEEESSCRRVRVTRKDGLEGDVEKARFCVGVEKAIADAQGYANAIAKSLHGPDAIDPTTDSIIQSTKMDSQAKYAVLARAGAEIYLRLPKPGYVEWIWDHAAGNVVITEAGGQMTDVDGNEIDFSLGAKLSPNVRGILGSNGGRVHEAVVKAYRELTKEEE